MPNITYPLHFTVKKKNLKCHVLLKLLVCFLIPENNGKENFSPHVSIALNFSPRLVYKYKRKQSKNTVIRYLLLHLY